MIAAMAYSRQPIFVPPTSVDSSALVVGKSCEDACSVFSPEIYDAKKQVPIARHFTSGEVHGEAYSFMVDRNSSQSVVLSSQGVPPVSRCYVQASPSRVSCCSAAQLRVEKLQKTGPTPVVHSVLSVGSLPQFCYTTLDVAKLVHFEPIKFPQLGLVNVNFILSSLGPLFNLSKLSAPFNLLGSQFSDYMPVNLISKSRLSNFGNKLNFLLGPSFKSPRSICAVNLKFFQNTLGPLVVLSF